MPKTNSLPRSLSLKSRLEITRLLQNGQRFAGNSFVLRWQPSDEFRYTILVGRKHGPAVLRNRIKRLYREAIRLHRHRLPTTGKVLILPGRIDKGIELRAIEADVCRIFERVGR